MRIWLALPLAAMATACIPPSPDYPSSSSPKLETDMDLLFDERPVWEQAPVTDDGALGGDGVHIVKAGDTGIGIARAYGVPWSVIIDANGLSEPYILRIGQKLIVSPPASASNDAPTMEARASAFKLDIDDILTGGEPAQAGRPVPAGVAVGEPNRFTGGFVWPTQGNLVTRFGPADEGVINQGIEIATGPAAPIRASSDGVVAFVGNNVGGLGGTILIRHGNGWITAYGRAARTTVTRGQSVKRGEIIGATGSGTAPKLYFEMRKGRVPTDPLKQLPPV
jgi:murein DD-endopeptidase MepM/ murein hydrolase activator NlpD